MRRKNYRNVSFGREMGKYASLRAYLQRKRECSPFPGMSLSHSRFPPLLSVFPSHSIEMDVLLNRYNFIPSYIYNLM